MHQSQITTKEFNTFVNKITTIPYQRFFKRHQSFFIKYYSTELYTWFEEKFDTIHYLQDKFLTGNYISFIQGILSQDPRFQVFYGLENYGKHIFKTTYKNTDESPVKQFIKVNYEKLAKHEIKHNKHVFHIDVDEAPYSSGLILVLKNEYYDYYDQLK